MTVGRFSIGFAVLVAGAVVVVVAVGGQVGNAGHAASEQLQFFPRLAKKLSLRRSDLVAHSRSLI